MRGVPITNEVYTNKTSGEKVTNTDWHMVLKIKLLEICENTKRIKFIEGRLKTRNARQDKKDRYTTEINVDEFTFLSTKKSIDGIQPTIINPPAEEVNLQRTTFHFN